MVRGNWQKRVETAEARRREAKLRKSKSEDKRQYKNWVQELLQQLSNHESYCSSRQDETTLAVHVWTDRVDVSAIEERYPVLLDLIRSGGRSKDVLLDDRVKRNRSNSFQEGGNNGNSRRARSSSVNEKPSKKVHPRSKEGMDQNNNNNEDSLDKEKQWLCSCHFFMGKCEGKRKGQQQSCRCGSHYPSNESTLKTLFDVLQSSQSAEQAQKALPETEEEPGTMEMVYYIPLHLQYPHNQRRNKESEDGESSAFSDQFIQSLWETKTGLASIVYVAIGGTLVFDRNQEGPLLNKSMDSPEFWNVLSTVRSESPRLGRNRRSSSVGSEGDEADFRLLPGITLEQILCYLPDRSVAAACQVCKSWSNEIGQHSPELWRHLLKRRKWPVFWGNDEVSVDAVSSDLKKHFRETFLQHYSVWRDARALQHGLSSLLQSNNGSGSPEYASFDFASRKGYPSVNNPCVGIHEWSPHQALAAYAHDCSLRIFETAPTGSSARNYSLSCREVLCRRIDPYLNTKKRNCQLVSSGLDEEFVGCLGWVTSDMVDAVACVLIMVSREDFLVGDCSSGPSSGGADVNLTVIDIGESVLNYILSSQETDATTIEALTDVVDYLEAGGNLGQIDVKAMHQLAACGYGRFLLEVSISIPNWDDEDAPTRLSCRKLVLFSASVGAIVWISDSISLVTNLPPSQEHVEVSSFRKRHSDGSRGGCAIAVSASSETGQHVSRILSFDIGRSGEVEQNETLLCPAALNERNDRRWVIDRRLRVTAKYVVVGDSWEEQRNAAAPAQGPLPEFQPKRKVVVSFVPRLAYEEQSLRNDVVVIDGMEVEHLIGVRDDYVVLVCLAYPQHNADPLEGLEGHWFGGVAEENPPPKCVTTWAILIHIPSRKEIGRQQWLSHGSSVNDEELQPSLRLALPEDCIMSSVFCGLSWKGVVLTGEHIREVEGRKSSTIIRVDCSPVQHKSAKKKKKKTPKSGGKKDGFARGMSLRG